MRELKDQLIFENRYLEEQVKSLRNKYTNLTEHIRLKALHIFSINREEIEDYLQDDEFDGFQVIVNRFKNRVEVHKRKKPIKVIDTEGE
ncbi:hypothetical protein [Mammaliicoccus sciuri]|uniref:hypothetical protein n=1 Tax=Mammaliicoccus sciuri TaxID=1296 RepID=UPI002DB8F6CF|nr:hypothetical protein [Mammaliicoccus sciuri]MEB5758306.1 hypothetical protein [Mammaliicoccus sciuri]